MFNCNIGASESVGGWRQPALSRLKGRQEPRVVKYQVQCLNLKLNVVVVVVVGSWYFGLQSFKSLAVHGTTTRTGTIHHWLFCSTTKRMRGIGNRLINKLKKINMK